MRSKEIPRAIATRSRIISSLAKAVPDRSIQTRPPVAEIVSGPTLGSLGTVRTRFPEAPGPFLYRRHQRVRICRPLHIRPDSRSTLQRHSTAPGHWRDRRRAHRVRDHLEAFGRLRVKRFEAPNQSLHICRSLSYSSSEFYSAQKLALRHTASSAPRCGEPISSVRRGHGSKGGLRHDHVEAVESPAQTCSSATPPTAQIPEA